MKPRLKTFYLGTACAFTIILFGVLITGRGGLRYLFADGMETLDSRFRGRIEGVVPEEETPTEPAHSRERINGTFWSLSNKQGMDLSPLDAPNSSYEWVLQTVNKDNLTVKSLYEKGTLVEEREIEFDDNDNVLKRRVYHSGILKSEEEFTTNGGLKRTIVFDKDGNKQKQSVYTYNAQGLALLEEQDSEDTVTEQRSYRLRSDGSLLRVSITNGGAEAKKNVVEERGEVLLEAVEETNTGGKTLSQSNSGAEDSKVEIFEEIVTQTPFSRTIKIGSHLTTQRRNDNGKVVSEVVSQGEDIVNRIRYVYEEDILVSRSEESPVTGIVREVRYTTEGLPKEELLFEDERFILRQQYAYDDKGRLLSEEKTGTGRMKNEYFYEEGSGNISEVRYYKDNDLEKIRRYTASEEYYDEYYLDGESITRIYFKGNREEKRELAVAYTDGGDTSSSALVESSR